MHTYIAQVGHVWIRTSWCGTILVKKSNKEKKGSSKCIKAILCFSVARKSLEMTTFYHMASEIKPGRGLTTKLTTGVPEWLSQILQIYLQAEMRAGIHLYKK